MVQCYVEKNFSTVFKNNTPKLLYVCKADANHTKVPCAMHSHEDRLEILYISNGKGNHSIGGNQYNTEKGDILVYNSGVIHDEMTSPGSEMSVFCFSVSNLKLDGLRENCLLKDDAIPVLKSGSLSKDIENLFEIMYQQASSGHNGSSELCNNLANSLLILILTQIIVNSDEELTGNDIALKRIKSYIDDHYFEDLTLEKISEELNVSLSYLCHAFKDYTGYAPIQYIMRRRIGQAQILLVNTPHKAREIGIIVGYDNPNYFNTVFKKMVGMSPIKYRKCWVKK